MACQAPSQNPGTTLLALSIATRGLLARRLSLLPGAHSHCWECRDKNTQTRSSHTQVRSDGRFVAHNYVNSCAMYMLLTLMCILAHIPAVAPCVVENEPRPCDDQEGRKREPGTLQSGCTEFCWRARHGVVRPAWHDADLRHSVGSQSSLMVVT